MTEIDKDELKELFIEIKYDNKIAFEKLYKKYNKLVYGIVFSILKNKEDSEDVVQIIFEKLYSIDKNKLPTSKESSWLYSLAKNETISFLRRKNNNINLDKIYEIEDINNEINNIIAQDSYNKLICNLSETEKQIVSLKILGNFSFKEIAELIDEPVGTVKWRYYKSIHSLKILLGNVGMFIITLIIGVKTLFKKEKIANSQEEIIIKDENTIEIQENQRQEESKTTDIIEEYDKKDVSEGLLLEDRENSTNENIIIQEDTINNKIDFFGVGMLIISAIFFILIIKFSIKYQLKLKKKTSK